MAEIPSVKSFVLAQEQKEKDLAKAAEEKNVKWKVRLTNASAEFIDAITKACCKSIAEASASKNVAHRVGVAIKSLGSYQGLPGHVLLYGHHHGNWQEREPLELDVTPFERLQVNFYEKGWFLVEETDSTLSSLFVFGLYTWKPQCVTKLWHKHDKFDEKRISSLLQLLA